MLAGDIRSDDNWPSGRALVQAATYNERENIAALIARVLAVSPELQLLIIDDDSPDGTGEIALQESQTNPRLHVLIRRGRRGLGSAILEGFLVAKQRGFEIAINMDADFSHHPRYLSALLNGMSVADVSIGSRYVSGGGIVGWSLQRHVMSQGINVYSRILLGLRSRDCSGAFRCYRVQRLHEIDFSQFRSRGYAFQEEMLYRCARSGCRIIEIPIVFEDRIVGQSKINLTEILRALRDLFLLGLERLRGTPVRVTDCSTVSRESARNQENRRC